MNNNILNLNNIKLVGSNPKNNKQKKNISGSPPMNKKPTPFVQGFGRNKSQHRENTIQFHENQLQNHNPINNRPFNNNNIKFNNNKKNLQNKKITYTAYLKKDPLNDGYYDLHKANWDVSKQNRPTQKLRSIKLGDPFKVGNKHKTNFGSYGGRFPIKMTPVFGRTAYTFYNANKEFGPRVISNYTHDYNTNKSNDFCNDFAPLYVKKQ